jgi:hypothetical protein
LRASTIGAPAFGTTSEPPAGTSASAASWAPAGAALEPAELPEVSAAEVSEVAEVADASEVAELDDELLLGLLDEAELELLGAVVDVEGVALSLLPQAATKAAPATTPAPMAVRRETERPREPQPPGH